VAKYKRTILGRLSRVPTIRRPGSGLGNHTIALVSRILIAVLLLTSSIGKLAAPAATQGYIAAMGLPAPRAAYFASMTVELIESRNAMESPARTTTGSGAPQDSRQRRDRGRR
jgi:hypothetical protein